MNNVHFSFFYKHFNLDKIMTKKSAALIIFLASTAIGYSQEKSNTVEFGVGASEIRSKNYGALWGTSAEVKTATSIFTKNNWDINLGVELNALSFHNHLQKNTQNLFVGIPLSVRYTLDKENNLSPFFGIGIYGKASAFSKTQNEASKSFNGYTGGLQGEMGAILSKSENFAFGIKMSFDSDLFSTVKHQNETYKFSTINLGFELHIK